MHRGLGRFLGVNPAAALAAAVLFSTGWGAAFAEDPLPPIIDEIADDEITVGSGTYTGPTPSLSQGTAPITWSVVAGPVEMSINSSTGVVFWDTPVVSGSPHTNASGLHALSMKNWLYDTKCSDNVRRACKAVDLNPRMPSSIQSSTDKTKLRKLG